MKKHLLPIILSLMLLAVPVTADAPYSLIVDNVLVDKPVVMIDGTAYVPIRAVADIFDATTEWDGETGTITITKKGLERPPIKGDAEFVRKINAALDLLEEKDFPHYVMVCQNTWDIEAMETKPSAISQDTLAFHFAQGINIMPLLMDNPKRYTSMFLAGVLVHEACHATSNKYGELINEEEAYAHELAAFKLLDAPYWMQNECIGRDN